MQILASVLTLAIVASCAHIDANVASFSELSAGNSPEPIVILPWRQQMKDSLEFKTYAREMERRLVVRGFRVVSIDDRPQLVGFFDFGIDSGREVLSSYAIPQWGVTGYSGAYTSGVINTYGNTGTYSGTTTYVPQYGVTGYSTGVVSNTVYSRFINFDVVRIEPGKEPRKVYEGRLRSAGSCGNLASILPTLMDGLLQEFPGATSRRVTLPWDGKC
jgi:hypothetical protein